MSWPLTRPFSEAELYKQRLDEAMAANPDVKRPTFAMMRHSAVYAKADDWNKPVQALQRTLGQFENLFKNLGDVVNGFPKQIPLDELENRDEYNAEMLRENLMFGTPEQVINKLKRYEALGVDAFIYYASMNLDMASQKESLKLFCNEVMPAFS
jgi:alkanesulfonate monooxygenase SsuD/methylene tetrahydromethanopterin reductase-like flavin-dependent oxidoreductase (luciferase family)